MTCRRCRSGSMLSASLSYFLYVGISGCSGRIFKMPTDRLSFGDALGAFAPGQPLRAVLILTYCFDGRWFEEEVAPELFERPVVTMLLLRDRHALIFEAPSVRYHRADAAYSSNVFHP